MNTLEINAKYLALHGALGSRKDAEDKELFDQKHRQVWQNCDIELKARKEELLSLEELSEAEQDELNQLEIMFPSPPTIKPRDLPKEIDDLKAENILLREDLERLREVIK